MEIEDQKLETEEAGEPEAAAEQQPEAVVEQQPQAVVEQQPEAVAEQQPEAAVEQQPEAAVEPQPEAVAEQQPEAVAGQLALASPGDETGLKAAIEAIVYVCEEPATPAQIATALQQPLERIEALLAELVAEFAAPGHGLMVREVAGGYKMATKPEHHEAVRAFAKSLKPPLKLSLAALETLATIAYKQPVTAPEIMEIRGVQGAGVLKTLLDRKLIQTAGRKNVVGRPILYRTSKEFLMQFGLKDLSELPTLKEFEELRRLAAGDEPENAGGEPAGSGAASGESEISGEVPPTAAPLPSDPTGAVTEEPEGAETEPAQAAEALPPEAAAQDAEAVDSEPAAEASAAEAVDSEPPAEAQEPDAAEPEPVAAAEDAAPATPKPPEGQDG
jgi:segregation and condensation protein B